jgi:hypothetical protein
MSKIWLTETENLIGDVVQERQALAVEYEKLSKLLAAKDEELAHWKAVLQSYQKRQELEAPQPSLFLQQPDDLRNLSHRDVFLLVRDQNEGFIPMKQVTGLFKSKVANPDHAAAGAYSTLRRLVKQGKVAKVRAGLYRWVNGTGEKAPVAPVTGDS